MVKPGDIPPEQWIEAFAACRDSVNERGRPNVRSAVAHYLGLSPRQVHNRLDRDLELRDRCHIAAGMFKGVDRLLEEQGVDPDSVTPVAITANRWGDPESPSTQLKVRVVPRWSAVLPARADGWKRPKPPKAKPGVARTVAVFSDHHAPHIDDGLHAAACQWLREHKPDEIVVAGDLLDYGAVSRHRANPQWAASMQDCIDVGYRVLRDYLDAAPAARCTLIAGNHEDRLRNAILENLRAAFGVSRARHEPDDQDHAVLSLPHLLRLDELRVRFVGGVQPYAAYSHKISDTVAVRHGYLTRKGAGSSAVETIRHLRHSCIIGHCHRLAVVHLTAHDIDGRAHTIFGAEAGTMAKIEGGLGYAIAPDWQQGFVVATVWPDGSACARPVAFVNGRLLDS